MQLEEQLSFMEKYKITPNELLLVKMIFICRDDSNGKEFI